MSTYRFIKFSIALLQDASANRRTDLRDIVKQENVQNGQYFVLRNGEIDENLTTYFDYLVSARTGKEKTWDSYAGQLRIFFRYLDAISVNWKEVTPKILQIFYKKRRLGNSKKNISKNSWNLALAAIDSLYRWAVSEKIIEQSPVEKEQRNGYEISKLSESKENDKIVNFIDINDYKNKFIPLISSGKNRNYFRNLALCNLLISTGLRLDCEALNLRKLVFNNIDLEGPSWAGKRFLKLKITGKGGKSRYIKIHRDRVKEIQNYIKFERDVIVKKIFDGKSEPQELFLSERGTRLSASAFESLFRSICADTQGKVSVTPHGMRHTFAIYQLEAMIKKMIQKPDKKDIRDSIYKKMMEDPLRLLQKMLGHKHITTTYIYLDFLDENEALVEESLESWLGEWGANIYG